MTTPFFQSMPIVKPYALMDLDDTLFQTLRKIEQWQLLKQLPNKNLTIASVNKQGEPLSFFSQKQANFFNWLSQSCELIPVTARDTNEIKRVKLPFDSWQILTHGAILLEPNGKRNPIWQQKMFEQLMPLQNDLILLQNVLEQHSQTHDLGLVFSLHDDNFFDGNDFFDGNCYQNLKIYLAIKHHQKDEKILQDIAYNLANILKDNLPNFNQNFYIHVNANNLAILPNAIHKRHAVAFLLKQLDNNRPYFGFGDSLADLLFLQQLDWYGTPNHGQLHDKICQICHD